MRILKKFNIYLEFGVREYWIADPFERIVAVHISENEKYFTKYCGDTDTIPVHVLEGCEINLAEVFDPPPEALETTKLRPIPKFYKSL